MRNRNWLFTLNNPVVNEILWPEYCTYAIWQRERGIQGTEHLQGYCEFSHGIGLSVAKSILPTAHWESRKGNQEQAIAYCGKEETRIDGPWTHGTYTPKRPGQRTDILEVKACIDKGDSLYKIFTEHFETMLRYHRGFLLYSSLIPRNRPNPPRIFILVGPTRCGKSSFCQRNTRNAYWKSNDSDWWDGYDGQTDVILDDFYGWIQYSTLLRLLDRYPVLVQTKGGHRDFLGERIFITSNRDVGTWYNLKFDWLPALESRITEFGERVTDYTINLLNDYMLGQYTWLHPTAAPQAPRRTPRPGFLTC